MHSRANPIRNIVSATTPTSTPAAISLPKTGTRFNSIDLLRGLVMIIMALDHTRDFFHIQALTGDPTDMNTTTPLLFFTRFITHFCAPVFVFLAGTSAYFQSFRKSKSELSSFLIKRGLWLIVIEVAVVTLAITFDPGYHIIFLQTIWSIGISMMLLGVIIYLPYKAIFTIAAVILVGHNAMDYYEATHAATLPLWYDFLHKPAAFPIGKEHFVSIVYPFLSWTALMAMGYCFGKLYTNTTQEKRKKVLIMLGSALLLLFAILRGTNNYGDAQHWSTQKNGVYTFLSFINVVKYPPSLLYMCITIGPALLFLAFFGDVKNRLANIITIYGRVPFFYYILHFYLLHSISALFYLMRGHTLTQGMSGAVFKFSAPGEGYSLAIVYLVWLSVVVALYPLCKWFSKYKQEHKQWWLSYL